MGQHFWTRETACKTGQEKLSKVRPFLKWPGGKRWFVGRHDDVFPCEYRRYIEPFLGSGSVFFHLRPEHAILGDTNAELIAAYRGLRRGWRKAQALLREHQQRHDERHYYQIRARAPRCIIERAARLIYLNRACFNGIYRVNRKGEFNVPKGTRDSILFDTDDFASAARLLRGAEIRVADFEELIDEAKRNDLVFADPPYTVRHNVNGFIKYNEDLFSWTIRYGSRQRSREREIAARMWSRRMRITSPCVNSIGRTGSG
jgi:DNA adenine methylase